MYVCISCLVSLFGATKQLGSCCAVPRWGWLDCLRASAPYLRSFSVPLKYSCMPHMAVGWIVLTNPIIKEGYRRRYPCTVPTREFIHSCAPGIYLFLCDIFVRLLWQRSYPVSKELIEDAKDNLVLEGPVGGLPITCPVRLIHGYVLGFG